MADQTLLASLTAERRLALAYAPSQSKALFLALFALDARLATVVRSAREPMLAQIKLAWWRDELAKPPSQRAPGEPVLAALQCWGDAVQGAGHLVDGWEALLSEAPLASDDLAAFALARGQACAALADNLASDTEEAHRAGTEWALADLAANLSDPQERTAVLALVDQNLWTKPKLNKAMRPLLVLHGMARRNRQSGFNGFGPLTLFVAMRLGLFGI